MEARFAHHSHTATSEGSPETPESKTVEPSNELIDVNRHLFIVVVVGRLKDVHRKPHQSMTSDRVSTAVELVLYLMQIVELICPFGLEVFAKRP